MIVYELQVIGGKLFCDQDETLELKYFSKEEKSQLFTGSHVELWNDIFYQKWVTAVSAKASQPMFVTGYPAIACGTLTFFADPVYFVIVHRLSVTE